MLLSFTSLAFVDIFLNREKREGMELHRISYVLMGGETPYSIQTSHQQKLRRFLDLLFTHLGHSCDPLFLGCF